MRRIILLGLAALGCALGILSLLTSDPRHEARAQNLPVVETGPRPPYPRWQRPGPPVELAPDLVSAENATARAADVTRDDQRTPSDAASLEYSRGLAHRARVLEAQRIAGFEVLP